MGLNRTSSVAAHYLGIRLFLLRNDDPLLKVVVLGAAVVVSTGVTGQDDL